MNSKSLIWLVVFFFIIVEVHFAASSNNKKVNDEYVIQIKDRKITVEEFQSRLNDLPLPPASDLKELKENLLCTLIAETILYYEALKDNLDTLKVIKKYLAQYNNEALYEEWMNREVRDQIKFSEPELLEAYRRFKEERHVEYWVAKGIKEASELKASLVNNIPSNIKSEFKTLNYSESLDEVETIVYNLKQNEISDPVLVDSVYYVFRLVQQAPNEQHSKGNFLYWKPALEKILRSRKEKSILADKLVALMGTKSFTLQKEPFEYLYSRVRSVVYKNNEGAQSPENIQHELVLTEINPSIANRDVVIFNDNKTWTAAELWEKISVSPYPLNYKNPNDLKPGLVDVINKLFLLESISGDASLKGYHSAGFVNAQSAMWKTNLIAQALIEKEKRSISVTGNDLIKYYDSNKANYIKPEQRRVIPIILSNESAANEVYGKLNSENFTSLAKEYSINSVGLDEANTGVFITKEYWGDAGKAAFRLMPGEYTKPARLSDSTYMILKVLEIQSASTYSFEEIKDNLAGFYEDQKLQEKIHNILNLVVPKYKIKINKNALSKVNYFGGNMGIKKTHFPLRSVVPGFPYFYSNAKWFKAINK